MPFDRRTADLALMPIDLFSTILKRRPEIACDIGCNIVCSKFERIWNKFIKTLRFGWYSRVLFPDTIRHSYKMEIKCKIAVQHSVQAVVSFPDCCHGLIQLPQTLHLELAFINAVIRGLLSQRTQVE